jgi:hypothetical protein
LVLTRREWRHIFQDWNPSKTMKKILALVAAGVCLLLSAEPASAQYPSASPYGAGGGSTLFHRLFVKQPLPAFQAAPWYLYWPYHAHFMTPAPLGLGAPYYGAPTGMGGFGGGAGGANPFFPNAGMLAPRK